MYEETSRREVLRNLLIQTAWYVRRFRAAHCTVDVTIKSDRSPVTEIDYLVQLLFEMTIRTLFPRDRLIGEEAILPEIADEVRMRHAGIFDAVLQAMEKWPRDDHLSAIWIIDPVDGTKGFIENLVYATGVAVIMGGQPRIAGIAVNGLEGVFPTLSAQPIIALAGEGGVEISYTDGTDVVAPFTNPQIVLTSKRFYSHKFDDIFAQLHAYRLLGIDSMAKYVAVLLGAGVAYLRMPVANFSKIWDHLPGLFLLAQQKGQCVDFHGAPIRFFLEDEAVDLRNGLICCLTPAEASKFVRIMQESRRLLKTNESAGKS